MAYPMTDRYREMEIMAMTPAKRVVLLYTHLLASLQQARGFLVSGDVEAREGRLAKAEGIVLELAVSLDREQGGTLAAELSSIYAWMLTEITRVHARADLAGLDGLLRIARELHAAWDAAAEQVGAEAAGAAV